MIGTRELDRSSEVFARLMYMLTARSVLGMHVLALGAFLLPRSLIGILGAYKQLLEAT